MPIKGEIRPKPWEVATKSQDQQVPSISTGTDSVATIGIHDQNANDTKDKLRGNSKSTQQIAEKLLVHDGSLTEPSPSNNIDSVTTVIDQPGNYGMMEPGYTFQNSFSRNGMLDSGFSSYYGNRVGGMYGNPYGSMFGSPYSSANYGMRPLDANNPTQAAFQFIENIIGTFTGFAQMLEATYMATHNSFFTMISVAEQFKAFNNMLGSAFGIFTIMKFLKKLLNRSVEKPEPVHNDFTNFNHDEDSTQLEEEDNEKVKKSRSTPLKPILLFLGIVFATPTLLKNIQLITTYINNRNLLEKCRKLQVPQLARAIKNFIPENPSMELKLSKNDLVALEPNQNWEATIAGWWKVKTQSNKIGYAPIKYFKLIRRSADTSDD